MKARAGFTGIRAQLLLLFALVVATAGTVIVIDENLQRRQLAALERLNDQSLATLAHRKALADAYSLRIGATTFQVRNGLMDWSDAAVVVGESLVDIEEGWRALEAIDHPPRSRQLLEQARGPREEAAASIEILRNVIEYRDARSLADFADTRLFPGILPVLSALTELADAELAHADAEVRRQARAARQASALRLGISVGSLLVVVLVGRRIVVNIYRGVESLNELARGVEAGDFQREPSFQPRGELATVQRSLLDMRRAVRSNERALGEQIQRNEAMLRQLSESEASAHAANATKSDFLATMSHEIRTPMIGVTGMLEVLSHTALDGEQRRCISVIEHSADALLQILGDILDFSRIESGRLELDAAPTDLSRLVQSTVANFQGAASSRGLELACSIELGLAPAHLLDALRLRQVLTNLVSNAIKFTDSGSVRVRVVPGEIVDGRQAVRMEVVDTGVGIDPGQQAALFEPFSQVRTSDTSSRRGGTGLGLAICRRLMTLMDGEIGMDSHPGRGTRMWLTFQAALSDRPAVEPARDRVRRARGGRAARVAPDEATAEAERSLVLLVDDHPTNRQVIGRQLALAGFASVPAANGEEGLALWRSGRFALVLTDVHMPVLDGYQLTRAIREEEAIADARRTPVIALTAAALRGEAERCLAAGMDDYLAKPAAIETLRERLHRWLPHLDAVRSATPRARDPEPDAWPAGIDAEVMAEFLAACEQDLHELQQARDRGELAQVRRCAHRLRGAAGLVGAAELATQAAQLEHAAAASQWNELLAASVAVESALVALRRRLDADAGRDQPAG